MTRIRFLLALIFIWLNSHLMNSQSRGSFQFDESGTDSLVAVLKEVQSKTTIQFFFKPEWLTPFGIVEYQSGQALDDFLDDLFEKSDLSVVRLYPSTWVIIKDQQQLLRHKGNLEIAMDADLKIEQLSIGARGLLSENSDLQFRGRVLDSKTNDPLPFASIRLDGGTSSITTDESGRFYMEMSAGKHVLALSYLEYGTKIIDLEVWESGELNLMLEKESVLLDEVVIRARFDEIATSRIGQKQLDIPDLKRAPAFLGEADLIKQIQSLPGVSTVGEAAAGFNVRGGGVDQNLILYDGVPVFNSSHVFGFFSAFNTDAVRNVSFYSGGIPAEYGGRISSVLDIQSTDGDYERWRVKAGIGMVTSNFSIKGPLKKEKTAIDVSFRSTYSDWLVNSIETNYADLSNSTVSFYDGSFKLAHLLDKNTKLSFTGYLSKDGFRLVGDSTYSWQTRLLSTILDHQFSPQLAGTFTVGITDYGYEVKNKDFLTASKLSYQVTTGVSKAHFDLQKGTNIYGFGGQLQIYHFKPGQLRPASSVSNAKSISLDPQSSVEGAFYLSEERPLADRITLEWGVRWSYFASFGKNEVLKYERGKPRSASTIIDTMQFGNGSIERFYTGLEPRITARWMTSQTSSIKFGYHRVYQYLNLITNTTAVSPVDVWQPSDYYFKPQRADQISLGYFRETLSKKYSLSSEGYFKYMKNVPDFKDGAQLVLKERLELDLLQGIGWSYGLESGITKNEGRFTGSASYTYSRTKRRIEGWSAAESINAGKVFPSNFDQPHNLNLSWKYHLRRRIFYFTGNFIYHTGRPITVPVSAFNVENLPVAYFSQRNQYRIPDYHRLDLAFVIDGNNKRRKNGESSWVFSIYNVYGRKNPYTIFFKSSSAGILSPYQLSIIGVPFPSISYNIKFQ